MSHALAKIYLLDTGHNLIANKMSKRRPGCFLNVICTGRLRLPFDFRISGKIFLIQKLLQPQANSKDNLDEKGCGNRIPVIVKRLKIIKNH